MGPSPAVAASLASIPRRPPTTCVLTKPTDDFVPPRPAPAQPPAAYSSGWFGSAAIWTMLADQGEVWAALPQESGGFSQKTFWWSNDWDSSEEPMPKIAVTGRRLDGSDALSRTGGTNAAADFGSAMLVGIDIPTAGCWELTGTYRGESLSYVVWVAD